MTSINNNSDHGRGSAPMECTLDQAARLVRRLLRSHGEKSSRRSVYARSDAGLWLARYDSQKDKTQTLAHKAIGKDRE